MHPVFFSTDVLGSFKLFLLRLCALLEEIKKMLCIFKREVEREKERAKEEERTRVRQTDRDIDSKRERDKLSLIKTKTDEKSNKCVAAVYAK